MEANKTTQSDQPSTGELQKVTHLLNRLIRKLSMTADEHDAAQMGLALLQTLAEEGLQSRIRKNTEPVRQSEEDGEGKKLKTSSGIFRKCCGVAIEEGHHKNCFFRKAEIKEETFQDGQHY